ncbi:MAG: DUF952 domain-containing protein [Zavarzinia sp.]|nr:DUF952 domain-containing protein [Zavarzinia sp.]
MTDTIVYKVMDAEAWARFQAEGVFLGAPVDLADGFIHFSAAHQVQGTLDKHFGGAPDLMLVAIEADRLGPALKWEVSRGGDLFPHLYATLSLSSVIATAPLALDAEGRHVASDAIVACAGGA